MTTTNGVAKASFILSMGRYSSLKDLALSVWVTRLGELKPLQATGGWLIARPVIQ